MVELGTVHRVKSSITVERLKAYNKAKKHRLHYKKKTRKNGV
jgi:hypothetical protein